MSLSLLTPIDPAKLPDTTNPETFEENAQYQFMIENPRFRQEINDFISAFNIAIQDADSVVGAVSALQTLVQNIENLINSLQQDIATKADKNGNSSENFNAKDFTGDTLNLGPWVIYVDGSALKFKHNGVNRLSLDNAGNLIAESDVIGFGDV